MIEITSFLLKHLYELMADNYSHSATASRNQTRSSSVDRRSRNQENSGSIRAQDDGSPTQLQVQASSRAQQQWTSREQETNQQIVSFLANNHLPDLICETFIEILFICVFLAVSWIFVMIIQLHCHQLQQPAKLFYCNTKFLASLMYCNNKFHSASC